MFSWVDFQWSAIFFFFSGSSFLLFVSYFFFFFFFLEKWFLFYLLFSLSMCLIFFSILLINLICECLLESWLGRERNWDPKWKLETQMKEKKIVYNIDWMLSCFCFQYFFCCTRNVPKKINFWGSIYPQKIYISFCLSWLWIFFTK